MSSNQITGDENTELNRLPATTCSVDWESVTWIGLQKGEVIKKGDYVDSAPDGWRDDPRWVLIGQNSIGKLAPDPVYPSHRRFRRVVDE